MPIVDMIEETTGGMRDTGRGKRETDREAETETKTQREF